MDEKQLLKWFNSKVPGNLKSIEDAKTGKEICQFMVLLAGDPKYQAKISMGSTTSDYSANFHLAKYMMMKQLNLPFNYTIAKLVDGNIEELSKLIQELKNLDGQEDDLNSIPLDTLLDALENDLTEKWDSCLEFRGELDRISKERTFYFDKLSAIAKECPKYNKKDIETVRQILILPPTDFLPPEGK